MRWFPDTSECAREGGSQVGGVSRSASAYIYSVAAFAFLWVVFAYGVLLRPEICAGNFWRLANVDNNNVNARR